MPPLRTANLILAYIATIAPLAHVSELASKLSLNAPVWLAVQQNLYRGWGPLFGTVEIAALLSTCTLLSMRWHTRERGVYLGAAVCYAAMIAVFFVFNRPVNEALSGWTAATIAADWSAYRLRWEIGHALAALFAVIAFITLIRHRIRVSPD